MASTFLVLILSLVCYTSALQHRFGLPSTTIHVHEDESFHSMHTVYSDLFKHGSEEFSAELEAELTFNGAHRSRRSISTRSTNTPTSVRADLHGDKHTTLIVHWAGEGSDLILALAKNSSESEATAVFVSNNYGKSFTDINPKLKVESTGQQAIIYKYYAVEKFNSHYLFADIHDSCVFTTDDGCETFVRHCGLRFKPRTVAIHRENPRFLLGLDEESDLKQLYLSSDFGANWIHVLSNVKTFYWDFPDAEDSSRIFVHEEQAGGKGQILAMSMAVYASSGSRGHGLRGRPDAEVMLTDVVDFQVKGDYIFATKSVRLLGSKNHGPTLQLWISHKGNRFSRAEFPVIHNITDYFVADASEGQLMVCVSINESYANLYISDVNSFKFSLSLERVVYFNPKSASRGWLKTNTNKTFADVTKIHGVGGIYIASQHVGHNALLDSQVSYITYDKGGIWQPISPPEYTLDNRPSECPKTSSCSLHLTQTFQQLFPEMRSYPILSQASAPGLVIASGVLGSTLKGDPDVFVSASAGVKWRAALSGLYMYATADQGGIIAAVHQLEITDELLYSTNEGEAWSSYKFSQSKMRVFGLLTEPGENTTVFTVFGSPTSHHSWMIIQVDMKDVFQGKKCEEHNYKMWSVNDDLPSDQDGCLLGRITLYQRRNPNTVCYNGKDFVRTTEESSCACTREDFECDYGFKEDDDTSEVCVRDLAVPDRLINRVPDYCTAGLFYNFSRGYRKVPGDSCEGGKEHRYRPVPYSCPAKRRTEFLLLTSPVNIGMLDLANGASVNILNISVSDQVAAAFDWDKNVVIYKSADGSIKKTSLEANNTYNEVLLPAAPHMSVRSLAFDWTGRNIYYISASSSDNKAVIGLVNVDFRFQREIYSSLYEAGSLVLDPHDGYLYFIGAAKAGNSDHHIYRAAMDGSDSKPVMVLNDTMVVGANSPLTLDQESGQLYWVDGQLYSALVSGHDTGKKTNNSANPTMLNITAVVRSYSDFASVSGLAVFKSYIYFSYGNSAVVKMAPKNNLNSLTVFANYLRPVGGLALVSNTSHHAMSACSPYNKPCSQLCLPRPSSGVGGAHNRSCLCDAGFKATKTPGSTHDETCHCEDREVMDTKTKTCVRALNETGCGDSRKFNCNNGHCINAGFKCDGDNDCMDGSDELDCAYETCSPDSFTCHSGHCIPKRWRCDREDDCRDGMQSDEIGCEAITCASDQWRCKNNYCINLDWRCDQENDCHDNSDEDNCGSTGNTTCSAWEFSCNDGTCVDSFYRCNHRTDCPDGSDEAACGDVNCARFSERPCGDANNTCVRASWFCDGEEDCPNGKDEEDCDTTSLPVTTDTPRRCKGYACDNGFCVGWGEVCNGVDDCGDSSDEYGCWDYSPQNATTTTPSPCGANFYSCTSMTTGQPRCLPLSSRCNTIVDCADGSDEEGCSGGRCLADQFECESTANCIWKSFVCDGADDCPNGEDEKNCGGKRTCSPHDWVCVKSGVCIPSSGRCNKTLECDDASDEIGCDTDIKCSVFNNHLEECCQDSRCSVYVTHKKFWIFEEGLCKPITEALENRDQNHCGATSPADYKCGKDQFACNTNRECVSYTQVCNNHKDCSNNLDEIGCDCNRDKRTPPAIAHVTNHSVSWIVDKGFSNFSYARIEAGYERANLSWVRHPAVTDDHVTVDHLTPASRYSFVFNYKDSHCLSEPFSVMLDDGLPSEPRNVKVSSQQEYTYDDTRSFFNFTVRVGWEAPLKPQGSILFYVIYYQQIFSNGSAASGIYEERLSTEKLTITAKKDVRMVVTVTEHIIEGRNYHFWMAAMTKAGLGKSSEKKSVKISVGPEKSLQIKVKLISGSSILVSWSKSSEAKGYKVTVSFVDGEVAIPDRVILLDGSKTSVKIQDLCPGTSPSVSVAVRLGDSTAYDLHPMDSKRIVLAGKTPKASISDLKVVGPTTVMLSYSSTQTTADMEYYIFFTHDISKTARNVTVYDTSHIIRGLYACERYFVWMRSSHHTCPASQRKSFLTQEDPAAPPRDVRAQPIRKVDLYNVNLTWRPSCGHLLLDTGYIITVQAGDQPEYMFRKNYTEKNHLITQEFKDVTPGITYKFKVRTDVAGSRMSDPVEVNIPSLDGPINLVAFAVGPKTVMVHWDWPPQKDTQSFKEFVLHTSGPQGLVLSNHTAKSTLDITVTNKGVYKFTVEVKDTEDRTIAETSGPYEFVFESEYIGPPSSGGDSSMSNGHLVAIMVPVSLVVVLLSAALVFFIVRHRRLQRSFLAFANSHYNIQSGTTTFSDDLDGDEPMIQGFADDEPLVIA